ncbi:cell division protein FtsA [Limosilactobacillus pontis]|uniref:Cell division protein FtsA n=1 Tax=Limosilactobacillus pontis DSM 8475 TaxID=1423794 RepID=A0A922PTY2_9LACO|nr:cell division protein FtsA [Limosilactobacillus pontis]KRM35214.1 cell division protein FtsA [Limosilactobacillus pontis DSM 8475]QFV00770.1 cell division protein FtsA [Limosilactobacillus pontis]
MNNSEVYVGLDIGTTSIKAMVCENVKGQLKVISVGVVPSAGLNRGVIVDIDKTARAIFQAVKKAEARSNIDIKNVVVGLPANYLQMQRVHGSITIASQGQSREITDRDVIDVAKETLTQSISPELAVLDLIPTEFTVDGFNGIKDPRGMVGVRLEMKGTLYTGPKTIIHNTKKAVQQAGYGIRDFVIAPIATGFTLLNDGEQYFGTVVIDLGGGQTTTSIIHDHQLKYTFVDPEGGQYVTRDISTVLNTSLRNAERLKLDHGYAMANLTKADAQVDVPVVGENTPQQFSEEYLAEIIEARVRQILERSVQRLHAIHAPRLPGGVVLVGGGASLPGIVQLAQQYFKESVKVYQPEQMGVRYPRYSLALALTMYESQLTDVDRLIKQTLQQTDLITSPHETAVKPRPAQANKGQWTATPTQPSTANQAVEKKPAHAKKNKSHSIGNRFKSMFNNLFD